MDNFLFKLNFIIAGCFIKNIASSTSVIHHNKWESDPEHKFSLWQHDRIWYIDKLNGHAHVVTTFGEFDIEEGEAYYIPGESIISTCLKGEMIQTHMEFLTISPSIDVSSVYDFSCISNRPQLVQSLIQAIYHEYKIDVQCEPFLKSLLCSLLTCFSPSLKDISDSIKQFNNVLKYIDNNLSSNISVSNLADLMGYSTNYFTTKFNKLLNVSPLEYITNRRIDKAKVFLLTTQKPINQISIECGFTDSLYFSRIFKKVTGYSPLLFRKIFTLK